MNEGKKVVVQERVKELLDYCSTSGLFVWKTARRGIKVNSVAGSVNSEGYVQIMVDGKLYLAHRLAFLYMTGEFPTEQVDHINGVRTDSFMRLPIALGSRAG